MVKRVGGSGTVSRTGEKHSDEETSALSRAVVRPAKKSRADRADVSKAKLPSLDSVLNGAVVIEDR